MTSVFALVHHQFIDFIEIVKSEIIIDRFRRQYAWEKLTERLHSIDCAVTTNTDHSVNFEGLKSLFDLGHNVSLTAIDIGARCSQQRPTHVWGEFGNCRKEGIQADVRYSWVEDSRKSTNKSNHFNLEGIRSLDRSVDRGIQRRCITACS